MGATSQNKEKFEDYEGFTAKFKPKKKTTDDCYTPPDVYKAVKDWCIKENNWGGADDCPSLLSGRRL